MFGVYPRQGVLSIICLVRILVSNDDGYLAPGIVALAEALSTVADRKSVV